MRAPISGPGERCGTSAFFVLTSKLRWAKFKCYCDQTTEAKDTAVANYTTTIEALAATITDRTAQSAQLAAEMATLAADMNENAKVRQTSR